jgi:hypothetical protein
MNAIFGVLLTLLLTMAMLAGIVFCLGDTSVFVPPPEAVAEGFMREMATGRYERAREYLSKDLAARTGPDELKALAESLKGWTGEILDVRGEQGWSNGQRGEAYTKLKTRQAGEPSLRLALWREEGVWAINGLWSLEVNPVEEH